MASLRDFLYGYDEAREIIPQDFAVWNTNTKTAANGGRCCLWTVPDNVSFATFEIWSAGGSGAMSCCCMQGGAAGSGGYAIKTCTVSPGQQIRICAGSTGCCTTNWDGQCGCCSFVCSLGGGGQGTWETKVCGGRCTTVSNRCFYFANCYGCCSQCFCCGGIAENASFFIPGVTGAGQPSQHCYDQGHQFAGNAPMAQSGPRIGPNGCCRWGGNCGFGHHPGGGGISGQSYGNSCCCGGPGGGGMVYVVYY